MTDPALRDLAARAGILTEWIDAFGTTRQVAPPTLRTILTALGLPCRTREDIAAGRRKLARSRAAPALVFGTVGRRIFVSGGSAKAKSYGEDGDPRDVSLRNGTIPPIAKPGYHRLTVGRREIELAIAPERCFSIADLSPRGRLWGVATQIYGLRRTGDGGIGDFGGVAELARAVARDGADAIALSPIHALFGARPERFAPYSPSSRLFLNPLHADPALVLGPERVRRARAAIGPGRDGGALIDWPRRSAEKLALFHALFDAMPRAGLVAEDLARFRVTGGAALARHAAFEARATESGPDFQIFLQWLSRRSLAAAQSSAREVGMRIGLIADIAVGVDPHGSDAAIYGENLLMNLTIGAPPDLFNPKGQNWGLTALSPSAMAAANYRPFVDVLRAAMDGAGGIRLDHAMGLARLWLIPDGARPGEGAYLTYPLDDLLRLIALESMRHRAIVVAEDLGTVPPGFSTRLAEAGILGMSILYFERDRATFRPPQKWRRDATAMTSTHDLPPVASWWRGKDITTRAALKIVDPSEAKSLAARRTRDRASLWRSFIESGCVRGRQPNPRETHRVIGGAVLFVARTAARLALFPLEDLIGEAAQPNLPGTIDEHPNWRQRQKADVAKLLSAPKIAARLRALKRERPRK